MVVFTVSISEALVTFFLPEDLGTYLVVGEGIGAREWKQGNLGFTEDDVTTT